MFRRVLLSIGFFAATAAGLYWSYNSAPDPLSTEVFYEKYQQPLTAPAPELAVFHLGHSLVGRDMPAMLAALGDHRYDFQLGWGASLKGHWTNGVPGFAEENVGPNFRPAHEAIESGEYGAIVLTEMVEIKDAIRYFDSAKYLALWVKQARAANPSSRIYLYETWHRLDDNQGWEDRLENDLAVYWEGELLRAAMAVEGVGTIHVIPGGQVMLAVVKAMENGDIPNLSHREELFARDDSGQVDPIHFNKLGAWLMAMTHYAVIYQTSPIGLPASLPDENGQLTPDIPIETATALQAIVWKVVQGYALTGVKKG